MQLTDQEVVCIRVLAKLFSDGKAIVTNEEALASLKAEGVELDEGAYVNMMRTMEHCGAIDNVRNLLRNRYARFRPTPAAAQMARELEARSEKKEDIVGQIYEATRRHRVLAWILITFFVIATVVTAVNQGVQLLKTIGWL